MSTAPVGRRFYRLRAPDPTTPNGAAVSVRATDHEELYLAIGTGRRRMRLTLAEAWALWRCLSEAVASCGQPPDWLRVDLPPTPR